MHGEVDKDSGDEILEQVVALWLRNGDRSEHSRTGAIMAAIDGLLLIVPVCN